MAEAPKDRWHQLAGAILDSNLPASDKSVFRFLLDVADWKTAELPAKFTPTRKTIARKTSLSYSQTGYSTRHLERHGWLSAKGATGPGHPLEYRFTLGGQCDCTGRVHVPQRCQPGKATVPTDDPRTLPTNGANAAGQTPSPTERHREGDVEGKGKPKIRQPPDWLLINQIVRYVHNAPGGGLHRLELAEKLGLPDRGPSMREALGIAYRQRKIDFCRQYVVKPAEKTAP